MEKMRASSPPKSSSKSRDRGSSKDRDRDRTRSAPSEAKDVEADRSSSASDSKEVGQTAEEVKAAKKAASRAKYGKKFKETKKVFALTEEQRMAAMLGHGYEAGGEDPRFTMEQYCGCCGMEHKAPELLDCYYLCGACQNALREPSVLREAWKDRPQACDLEICYASYGHPNMPMAYEVTKAVQQRVDMIWYRDRLQYKKTENLTVRACMWRGVCLWRGMFLVVSRENCIQALHSNLPLLHPCRRCSAGSWRSPRSAGTPVRARISSSRCATA